MFSYLLSDITQILNSMEQGDPQAASQLMPLAYEELRKLAACKLAYETPGHTLSATALVHEAYLRLVGDQQFANRRHFLGAAAHAMRGILIDSARRKQLMPRVDMTGIEPALHDDSRLLELNDARRFGRNRHCLFWLRQLPGLLRCTGAAFQRPFGAIFVAK